MRGGYRVVVTRYGGARHLAPFSGLDTPASRMSRHFTACGGTSSWTIEEWGRMPQHDLSPHPQGLTPDDMRRLPPCDRCIHITRFNLSPSDIDGLLGVTPRHTLRHITVSDGFEAGDPVVRLCEPDTTAAAQWDMGRAPADVPVCTSCIERVMQWINSRGEAPLLMSEVQEGGGS